MYEAAWPPARRIRGRRRGPAGCGRRLARAPVRRCSTRAPVKHRERLAAVMPGARRPATPSRPSRARPRLCERQCASCNLWKHHSRFASRRRDSPNGTVWEFDADCRACQQKARNLGPGRARPDTGRPRSRRSPEGRVVALVTLSRGQGGRAIHAPSHSLTIARVAGHAGRSETPGGEGAGVSCRRPETIRSGRRRLLAVPDVADASADCSAGGPSRYSRTSAVSAAARMRARALTRCPRRR